MSAFSAGRRMMDAAAMPPGALRDHLLETAAVEIERRLNPKQTLAPQPAAQVKKPAPKGKP
jgi:L-ascorbate metabolism protein UlaG (beta-lactamase superfamily)